MGKKSEMDERTGIRHREGLRVVGKFPIFDTFGKRHCYLVLSDGKRRLRRLVSDGVYAIAAVGEKGCSVEELNPDFGYVQTVEDESEVDGKPWLNAYVVDRRVVN